MDRLQDEMHAQCKYALDWHSAARQIILATMDWCWERNTTRRSGTTLNNSDSTLRVLATTVEVHEQIWKQSKHVLKRGLNTCEIIHNKACKVRLQEKCNLNGPETRTNGTNFAQRAKKTNNVRGLHLSNGIGYGLDMKILSLWACNM
jgi:hypothetical protein